MGIFNWLKPKPRISIEQLSYDIAYEIFPHYVFRQAQSVLDVVESSPETAAAVFYHIACKSRGVTPIEAHAESYRLSLGHLEESHVCLTMEYPTPRPISLPSQSFEAVADAIRAGELVVAPFFSVAVARTGADFTDCFVLGQTLTGEPTAIRSVDGDGANVSLGPGPEPRLNLFLAEVRRHLASRDAS
jgi:hypothetical protein